MVEADREPSVERILVRPVEGGWTVESRLNPEPLFFFSGAKAEDSARKLGQAVARGRGEAEVVIHNRHDEVVGSTRYPPKGA